MPRIFTFYFWLSTGIAIVNKESFKFMDLDGDSHPVTPDPYHEPDCHKNVISCSTGHAPAVHYVQIPVISSKSIHNFFE